VIKIKIAIVTEYVAPKGKPYLGGVDARTINLAKQLVKDHEVHIITSFLENTSRIENYDSVKIHRVGPLRRHVQRGDFMNRIRLNKGFITELIKIKPDIVDASGFVAYFGAYRGARKLKIPVVVTVHEVWQGEWIKNMGLVDGVIGHFLELFYLKYPFDRYIAVSNFTKERLIKKVGIPEKKIRVIHNGVDLALYRNVKVDEKYENPTIVTICRLVKYKRLQDLLRALYILRNEYPDIKLKIVGEGSYENELKALTKNLNLSKNVEFLGKINDTKELIYILKKSHVFVLPSIVEGFGMVVIEAMAAGIPYVASQIPPIVEVINNGVGGLLFQPKNYKDLATKIKVLLEDEKLYTKLQRNMDEFVKRYDWVKIGREVEEFYHQVINQRIE